MALPPAGQVAESRSVALAFQRVDERLDALPTTQLLSDELAARDAAIAVRDRGEVSVVAYGADPTGAADSTSAFLAAVATGKSVFVPQGTFKITDIVTLKNGQQLRGAGRTKSILSIPSNFNLSALGVIRAGVSEPGAEIYDLGFTFAQANFSGMTRGDLIQFPPAIYAQNVPRFVVDRVRFTDGYDGLDARGNSGGCYIGFVESGCLNKGLQVDGMLDFWTLDRFHQWCFGNSTSSTSPLGLVYRDGAVFAASIGRTESAKINALQSYKAKIEFTANANLSSTTQQIDTIALDGDGARLLVGGGLWSVGQLYTTKTNAVSASSVVVTDASASISFASFDMDTSEVADAISVSAGRCAVHGGRWRFLSTSNSAAAVSGGVLAIESVEMAVPNLTRSVGYVRQSSSGALRVRNCNFDVKSGGVTGEAIVIGADLATNRVTGNALSGWALTLPANPNLGYYGPNSAPAASFTPALRFATPGDSVFTYAQQSGSYQTVDGGIEFEIRIQASVNAYTTASGNLIITGLPALTRGINGAACAVSIVQNITLTAGYTMVTAALRNVTTYSATGEIALYASGSGQPNTTIGTANVPASRADVLFSLTGRIVTGA